MRPAALLLLALVAGCFRQDAVAVLPCPGCAVERVAYCAGSGPPALGAAAARALQYALCTCAELGGDQPLHTISASGAGAVATNGKLDRTGEIAVEGTLTIAGSNGARTSSRLSAARLLCAGPLGGDGAMVDISGDAQAGGDVRLAALRVGGVLTLPEGATLTVSGASVVTELRRGAVAVPPPCPCAQEELLDIAGLTTAARVENDNGEIGLDAGLLDGFAGDQRLELACGRFFLRRIAGPGRLAIYATGRVALFVAADITMAEEVSVVLKPGAELDLFVAGPLNLSGPLLVDSGGAPDRTRIYAGAAGALNLSGGARLEAQLYAPQQDLALSGAAEISGALFLRRVLHTGPLTIRR